MSSLLPTSPRRAKLILVISVIIVAGMLGVHSILARIYYNLNSLELQTAADIAVRAGGEYLPGNPHAAMSIADAYLRRYGVAPDEIVFTGTTPDDLTLTIRLRRRMPWYMAALAIDLPSRIITVIATEQLRRDQSASVRLPNLIV